MSETKKPAKTTVRIAENELIDMIDNIINEAVAVEKKKWINEQKTKDTEKATMLENRIIALEKLITKK